MRKTTACILALTFAGNALAQTEIAPEWSAAQIAQLQTMIDDLPDEGLGNCNISSVFGPDNRAHPTFAAKQLAAAYLEGCAGGLGRSSWHIESHDNLIDSEKLLRLALARDELGLLFGALKPQNPNYQALRLALLSEKNSKKRATLALNMERWRWMPLHLGNKYLIVNAASFEVTLWEGHRRIKKWPVIVGKTTSPTPIFSTAVSGITLNPWWEIPSSIVAEGIGSLVRNNPAAARRKGYVLQNGRYRQRPGPGNALGQMKVIMPSPYSVLLHDTSNRTLFSNKVRTYSHGCIRVGGAIDFAKTVLANDMSGEKVDQILNSRATQSVPIATSIPIYIGYFTAESADDVGVVYYPDVYQRDGISMASKPETGEICSS